ncbi:59 protein [uncultured Caudovirales phage]|uniref:59 protein n=1 Tax=uncultured Caudovirales phage TaxID=2100421 RepID=A0A6J5KYE9_9CAUD|nr:59 protein [uncultured Caudovirales phage]
MDGYAAYRYYLAVKLHFTRDSYDIFEKRGAVKYSKDQFERRNDRMIFEKIARKYPKDHDLVQYLVSNIAYGNETPVYEIEESERYYLNWIKRKESITHIFNDELSIIINDAHKNKLKKESVLDFTFNQQPSILTLYLGKRISLETVSILNDFIGLTDMWNMSGFVMTFWESEIKRIYKVKRFIKYDKEKIRPLVNHFIDDLEDL